VKVQAPNVVVSFMDTMNITSLLSCIGTGIPVVVSERVDPSRHRIGRAKELLRNWSYRLAKIVVVQTPRIKEYFSASIKPRIRVIANPIPAPPLIARPDLVGPDGRWRMIAVGRLAHQKGLDRMVEAFRLIADYHPDWDLVLVGEGPERDRLESRIRGLGLVDRIRIKGVTTDITGELTASHLMAFPSRYEGFPNALAEGLAAGLPAVGFMNVSGVEDLIIDGKTGLLVQDENSPHGLARALSELMSDACRRAVMGEAARQHVMQWAPERILGQWERVLVEAALTAIDDR
jgi:glycosyltransferase involved in cell wall biosynthesis